MGRSTTLDCPAINKMSGMKSKNWLTFFRNETRLCPKNRVSLVFYGVLALQNLFQRQSSLFMVYNFCQLAHLACSLKWKIHFLPDWWKHMFEIISEKNWLSFELFYIKFNISFSYCERELYENNEAFRSLGNIIKCFLNRESIFSTAGKKF